MDKSKKNAKTPETGVCSCDMGTPKKVYTRIWREMALLRDLRLFQPSKKFEKNVKKGVAIEKLRVIIKLQTQYKIFRRKLS